MHTDDPRKLRVRDDDGAQIGQRLATEGSTEVPQEQQQRRRRLQLIGERAGREVAPADGVVQGKVDHQGCFMKANRQRSCWAEIETIATDDNGIRQRQDHAGRWPGWFGSTRANGWRATERDAEPTRLAKLALMLLPRRAFGTTPRIRYHALEAVDGAGADLAVVPITLLIGPNNDIDHELASRADRILLQWTTPAWLLIGIWVGRQRSPDEGLPR